MTEKKPIENENVEDNRDKDLDEEEEEVEEQGIQGQANKDMKSMAGMTEVEQTHLPQTRVKEALEFFKNDVQKRQTEIAQSKKALDKITIQKEHIPILKNEFELDETQAENVLRENGGDLKKAVESLLLKA